MITLNYSFSSLWNRFLLIIAVPIILLQIVTVCIFYVRHWSHVNDQMYNSLINEIKWIIIEVDHIKQNIDKTNLSIADKAASIKIARNNAYDKFNDVFKIYVADVSMSIAKNKIIKKKILDINLKEFANELSNIINCRVFDIKYVSDRKRVQCILQLASNDFLHIEFNSTRIRSGTTKIFVLWIIGSALLLFIVAWIFARNQIRSIVGFTNAVQNWSDCGDDFLFTPSGSEEIVAAGRAFLQMKKRLEENVKERTKFLTHIAHDMRTPLTRMRLQVAVCAGMHNKDDQESDNATRVKYKEAESNINSSDYYNLIDSINKNIDELDMLLNYYLDFVKSREVEPYIQINILDAITNFVTKFQDRRIKFVIDDNSRNTKNRCIAKVQVHSLERAIRNVVDNALKFANDQVMISTSLIRGRFILKIEDDGPGMQQKKYEDAFLAFTNNVHREGLSKKAFSKKHNKEKYFSEDRQLYRKEYLQHHCDVSGFGLGLSIAKDIINNNNGTIRFTKSKLSGLCVTISLLVNKIA